jgi:hypothetical protein
MVAYVPFCYYLQLSFDLLESWLAKNPDAAGFKKDGQSIFRELALFQDYHGLPEFKKVSPLLFFQVIKLIYK